MPSNDSATAPAASAFPRYGPSVPAQPTQSGHLIIFGGLVGESTRNDLYALDCKDFTVKPLQAHGTLPPPRVGHRSALVQSVFIVWGGDTKKHPSDGQDEALHLLNIQTKEWTRVLTNHPRPRGRYGHAVAMHESCFYVFGGQVDGSFMNDMWVFDLNSCEFQSNLPRSRAHPLTRLSSQWPKYLSGSKSLLQTNRHPQGPVTS